MGLENSQLNQKLNKEQREWLLDKWLELVYKYPEKRGAMKTVSKIARKLENKYLVNKTAQVKPRRRIVTDVEVPTGIEPGLEKTTPELVIEEPGTKGPQGKPSHTTPKARLSDSDLLQLIQLVKKNYTKLEELLGVLDSNHIESLRTNIKQLAESLPDNIETLNATNNIRTIRQIDNALKTPTDPSVVGNVGFVTSIENIAEVIINILNITDELKSYAPKLI